MQDGIADEFKAFIKARRGEPGAAFLEQAMDFAVKKLGMDPDQVVFELADGMQGDFYRTRRESFR